MANPYKPNKTGRHFNVGSKNPRAKLTEKIVDEIKDLLSYMTVAEVAKAYKVNYMRIWSINKGWSWDHI